MKRKTFFITIMLPTNMYSNELWFANKCKNITILSITKLYMVSFQIFLFQANMLTILQNKEKDEQIKGHTLIAKDSF